MPKSCRTDRCVNPFKKRNENGHKGKNLRKISSNILKHFPSFSKNSMICNSCIKKSANELSSEVMVTEELNDASMDSEENMVDSSLDGEVSKEDIGDFRSPREIELEETLKARSAKIMELEEKLNAQSLRVVELEEMLKGLKDKF